MIYIILYIIYLNDFTLSYKVVENTSLYYIILYVREL